MGDIPVIGLHFLLQINVSASIWFDTLEQRV